MQSTLASSVANLVMVLVYRACEIIICPEGIPCGLGGIDYTREGALEVPTISFCVVSVRSPVSAAIEVAFWVLCQNILATIYTAYETNHAKGLDASLITKRLIVFWEFLYSYI